MCRALCRPESSGCVERSRDEKASENLRINEWIKKKKGGSGLRGIKRNDGIERNRDSSSLTRISKIIFSYPVVACP